MKLMSQGLCLLLLCVTAVSSGCGDRRSDEQRLADALANIEAARYRAAVVDLKNLLRVNPDDRDARLALGEATLLLGDPQSAEKEILRARDLGADPNDYMVLWARALKQRRAFAELIAEIDPAAVSDPGQAAIVSALHGGAMIGLKSYGKAQSTFDEVLEKKAHPEARRLALLGNAELAKRNGDLAGAETLVRRSLDVAPESSESTLALGQILILQRKFEAAEKVFLYGREALKSSSIERFMLQAGLVESLLGQDRIEEGRAAADELAQIAANHPMTGYLRGRAAFQANNMPEAIEILQEALANFPNYPALQSLLGAANLRAGNTEQAEMLLASAVASDPGNTMARQLLAEARILLDRPDAAAQTLKDGLRNDARNAGLLAMLGRATVNQGDEALGISYLEESHRADPGNIQILVTLASAYVSAGRTDDAVAAIDKVPEGAITEQRREAILLLARFDPANPEVSIQEVNVMAAKWQDDIAILSIAGSLYLTTGDTGKARASFERVLEIKPDHRVAMLSLGRIDDATGDYSSSKVHFERYITEHPDDVIILLSLSRIAQREGEADKSAEYVTRANEADPNALLPNLILAGRAVAQRDLTKAERLARTAASQHPDAVQAHTTLAVILYRSNHLKEALKSMDRAIALRPEYSPYYFYRGQLQKSLSLLAQARESFVDAVRLDRSNMTAARELIVLEVRSGNNARAVEIVNTLKADNPGDARALEIEGDMYAIQNKAGDALVAYSKAWDMRPSASVAAKTYRVRRSSGAPEATALLERWLRDHPDDIARRLLLAQDFQAQAKIDAAIGQYETIVKVSPRDVVALNNLAWLYFEQGGTEARLRSLELAKKAHGIAPRARDVADTYGWILVRSGQVEGGASILRQAMSSTTAEASPDIAYHLAAALQEGGQKDEARRLLALALQGGGDFTSRKDAQTLHDSL